MTVFLRSAVQMGCRAGSCQRSVVVGGVQIYEKTDRKDRFEGKCDAVPVEQQSAYSATLSWTPSLATWSITLRNAATRSSIIVFVWNGPGVSRSLSVPRGTVG